MSVHPADSSAISHLAHLLAQAASPPAEPKDGFGGWWLDRESMCLVFRDELLGEIYDVDLGRCRTSAEMLDWIMQVASKSWASDSAIAGLVRALNHYLHPQATLCSFGSELGPINVRDVLR
ncbi:MAG: hypothetical protein ACREKF_14305 [Candidatus Methylomirabilales bacterium]